MESSSGFAEAATMSLASMEALYIAVKCMSTKNCIRAGSQLLSARVRGFVQNQFRARAAAPAGAGERHAYLAAAVGGARPVAAADGHHQRFRRRLSGAVVLAV